MYKINVEYSEYEKANAQMIQYVTKNLQKSETLDACKKSMSDFDPGDFLDHTITATYRKLCERAKDRKDGLLYMISTLIRREIKESIEEKTYTEKDVIVTVAICNKIDKLLQNGDEYEVTVMLTDIMVCICDDDRIAKLIDVETEDPWI